MNDYDLIDINNTVTLMYFYKRIGFGYDLHQPSTEIPKPQSC